MAAASVSCRIFIISIPSADQHQPVASGAACGQRDDPFIRIPFRFFAISGAPLNTVERALASGLGRFGSMSVLYAQSPCPLLGQR
jgi:hypothetical protein